MTIQRKEPVVRTCIACNASSDKRALVRFVRTPEGHVNCDGSGKARGRGAYICATASCFQNARKRRRLDSALKVTLREDDYDRLERDFTCLCVKRSDAQ